MARFYVRPDNTNIRVAVQGTRDCPVRTDIDAAAMWAWRKYGGTVTAERLDPPHRFRIIREGGEPSPTVYVYR